MAELQISERAGGADTVVLDLVGDVIFGESNTRLRNEIRRQISVGRNRISLNLNAVEYLDSSGIGELISSLTAINREEGGHLRILNPTERVMHLLKISRLDDIFDIDYEENIDPGVRSL